MDLEVLKKEISTFRGDDGRVRKVSDELLFEIFRPGRNGRAPQRDFTQPSE
jgi:hypothetical protein